TSVADMIAAYYSKAVDSNHIFDNLKISKSHGYSENLNKYNVINISFNKIPDNGKTYDDYMNMIKKSLVSDIVKYYPEINPDKFFTIGDMLESTGDKFIFVLDEWDYIFSKNLFEENQDDFLEFLAFLLKDQPFVLLCYMTGVLPIKRYSSGSALNMFDEFTFLKDRKFGEYFGFTEDEVLALCEQNKYMDFEKLQSWYNGYTTARGIKVYNPRSVVKALKNNYCESYWTNTKASKYLKCNTIEIREDIIKMFSGEEIDLTINEDFRAGQADPKTKEEIYSALITLGFLSYNDGYLKIPNKELMLEFENALKIKSNKI
ncbi:MAG: AAA family ATPase, partial [Intestinibacter sp.]